MGQRLNIEIMSNGNTLANCYYHWSGYTATSLELVKTITDSIESGDYSGNNVQGAIELLRKTGAEFNGEAWEAAKKEKLVEGDCPDCLGRNAGLIAVTEKEMKSTRDWEEGRNTIELDKKTIRFECLWKMEGVEDEDIWERIKDLFTNIDVSAYIWSIPFDRIDEVLEGVLRAQKETRGRFSIDGQGFTSIF